MIITKTPLRISFIGGGTDLENFYRQYPGRVISTSIDKYFYIGLNPRFDGRVRASYSEIEITDHCSQIKHPLIKASLEESGVEKGIDIVSLADIPAQKTGLGLGASSSFTVGLLNGLFSFSGKYFPPDVLAEKACKIEIEKAGSPIGKQDQYAAAFGGLNIINFNKDGSVKVEPIYLSPQIKDDFQSHLLMFFTGKERSANTILSEQKQNIDKKFEFLKRMSDLVPVFKSEIQLGNFEQAGKILHENWMMKKELASGISNLDIEQMYQTALSAGAFGGKILGAGGGGFLLIMASPKNHDKIKKALFSYQSIPFKFSEAGSKVVFKD
jgi:D-glycero-alpha-D-manno-heptose-7-phosphate kinase